MGHSLMKIANGGAQQSCEIRATTGVLRANDERNEVGPALVHRIERVLMELSVRILRN